MNYSHGHKRRDYESPTYACWKTARARCNNPKNHNYARYGGRGIKMCAEWAADFKCFLRDMGFKPDQMTLDRIDNDKGYEPTNCRWASFEQQARNKRNNRINWDEYRILKERYLAGTPMRVMGVERGVNRATIYKCIKRYDAWLDWQSRAGRTK